MYNIYIYIRVRILRDVYAKSCHLLALDGVCIYTHTLCIYTYIHTKKFIIFSPWMVCAYVHTHTCIHTYIHT